MIKISVVSYKNEAPTVAMSALFATEQGGIGSSDDNFLVLPDLDDQAQGAHAKAWSDGKRHQLINMHVANPIRINDKEMAVEQATDIHAGDQITMGAYVLKIDSVLPGNAANAAVAEPANMASKLSQTAQALAARMAKATPEAKANIQPPQFLLRPDSPTKPLGDVGAPSDASQPQSGQTPPAARANSASAEANALLQAFLNGAGLPNLNVSSGLTPELMETLGKLVATSVQGTMTLIAQRALVKREVNAEVTMVVLRKNNPIKFFPDGHAVLTQMLRKKMPGFMTPAEAMEDAFLDLRSHQLAVIAGMKAATDALLSKLQPTAIENQMPASNLLDYLNPARRKAAMWDYYAAMYERITLESNDEFQPLFGKEFLAAYEEEIERTKRSA